MGAEVIEFFYWAVIFA